MLPNTAGYETWSMDDARAALQSEKSLANRGEAQLDESMGVLGSAGVSSGLRLEFSRGRPGYALGFCKLHS